MTRFHCWRARRSLTGLNVLGLPVCLSSLLTVAVSHARVDSPPTTPPDQQPSAHPRVGLSYAEFYMPKSIMPGEIAWWADILDLSEAQRLAVTRLYDDFRVRDGAMRDEAMPWIWEESAAISAANDRNDNPVTAERYVDLLETRNRLADAVAKSEDHLLDQIDLVLAEAQRAQLMRVRDLRTRMRCTEVPFHYAGSQVDLTVMLYRGGLGSRFEPRDQEAFQIAIQDYEKQVTNLFSKHERTLLDLIVREMRFLTSIDDPSVDPNDPEQSARAKAYAESVVAECVAMTTEATRLDRQLLLVNNRYVDVIAATLPDEPARAFLATFRSVAYPSVYPNPFDITAILDNARILVTLNDDQALALAEIAKLYEKEEKHLSSSMVRRFVEYRDAYLQRRVFDYPAHAQFKQDMTALQNDRSALADKTLVQINGVLLPEQSAEIADEIDTYRKQSAAHKPFELGLEFRP